MSEADIHGVYGAPPADLAEVPAGALQFSPLRPGAEMLESHAGRLASITMLAPAGTIERGHELALALQAVRPGGAVTLMAPLKRGGGRLAAELRAFGIETEVASRRHHRIAHFARPAMLCGLDAAIAAGAPRILPDLGLWSQPGIFAFDRLDPATRLLIAAMPAPVGRGADFGCGIGILSRAVLVSPAVTALTLIDIDRRAVACAEHNVVDSRAAFLWVDIRAGTHLPVALDFIVMNPPFHDGGIEDRSLGQDFLRRAAEALRKGGRLYLTANRHLPYEAVLAERFAVTRPLGEAEGYKLIEAVR